VKRLDARTVEFTAAEAAVYRYFDGVLDEGHGIEAAARLALAHADMDHLDPRFVEYMSDGTLTVNGRNVALTAKGLTLHGSPTATPVAACSFALGRGDYCLLPQDHGGEHPTTREMATINAAVKDSLTHLDGSTEAAVGLLTGFTPAEIADLGGI